MAINKKKILKNAQKYTKKGAWDAAIDEYKKLLADNPKDRNLHNTVGDLYAKKKDNELAIKEYKLAANSFEEDGFIPQTIALYRKILRVDNTRVDIYSKLAQLYSDQGLAREAIAQYKTVADHYTKKGLVKKALDTYKQIADLDPSNLKVRIRLAELYNKEGLKDQAINEYLKIADLLNKKGAMEESFHLLQKVIEIDSTHLEAQKGLAKIYIGKGIFDKAVEALEIILAQDPENLQTLFLVGKAYFKAGSFEQAQAAFERILSIDPSQIGVRENLGRVYLQKDEFDNALVQFDQVIDNFIQKKEYDLAKNLLNKLIQFRPDHVRLRERIIEISEKLGDEKRVFDEFKALANIYIENEEFEKALNIYDHLAQKHPTDANIRNQLETLKAKVKPVIQVQAKTDIEIEEEIDKEIDEMDVDGMMEDVEIDIDDEDIEVPIIEEDFEIEESQKIDLDELEDEIEVDIVEIENDDFSEEDAEITLEVDETDIVVDVENEVPNEISEDVQVDEKIEEKIEIPVDEPPGEQNVEVVIEDEEPDIEVQEKITAPEIEIEEQEEELTEDKIVEDHVYHAEVYIKYGMTDKALEHLKSIVKIKKDHTESLIKMLQIYQDKENNEAATETANILSEIFANQGNSALAEKYRNFQKELIPDKAIEKDELPKEEIIVEAKSDDTVPEKAISEEVVQDEELQEDIISDEIIPEAEMKETIDEVEFVSNNEPVISDKEEKLIQKEVEIIESSEPAATSKKTPKSQSVKRPKTKKKVKSKKTASSLGVLEMLSKGTTKKKSKISKSSLSKLDSLAASVLKPTKKAKIKSKVSFADIESQITSHRKKPGFTPAKPVSIDFLKPKKTRKKTRKKEAPPIPAAAITPKIDYSKDIEEAEFYVQQGLIEEARKKYLEIIDKYPDATDIKERISDLETVPEAQKEMVEEPIATSEEAGEILQDLEKQEEVGEKKVEDVKDIPVEVSKTEEVAEESPKEEIEEVSEMLDFGLGEEMSGRRSTFEEEEDFFNLDEDSADEAMEDLFSNGQETSETEDADKSTEHSLQELFDEFRKGVDEQVASEDFETHYNLGIAYKEMGLVDEAINEFERASKAPSMFLQCCSMIGICYMETARYDEAIQEFSKGIEAKGYKQEEYLGLQYDLALTLELTGDLSKAYDVFSQVYEFDAKFREVSNKIKQLRKKLKTKGKLPSSPGGNVSYV